MITFRNQTHVTDESGADTGFRKGGGGVPGNCYLLNMLHSRACMPRSPLFLYEVLEPPPPQKKKGRGGWGGGGGPGPPKRNGEGGRGVLGIRRPPSPDSMANQAEN